MLKKFLLALLLVVVVLAGGVVYLFARKPAMNPPSAERVAATPERLARGKYLFEELADCSGCHSQHDYALFGAPVVAGGLAKGQTFPAELGMPGLVTAPNLTSDPETGLGNWTDGEIMRAVREGVSRDGRALFPMMPYGYYRHMSDEDLRSLVVFIRALPPVRNPLPRTALSFPVNVMITGAPQPVTAPVPPPDRSDKVKYGEYLATMGVCADCHTQMERGQYVESLRLAGGREFRIGQFVCNTANITPDPETGIGKWSADRFVSQFHNYRGFAGGTPPKATQANFTIMPWLSYSRLPEEDLRAIYAFLMTQKPISNSVTKHPEQPGS